MFKDTPTSEISEATVKQQPFTCSKRINSHYSSRSMLIYCFIGFNILTIKLRDTIVFRSYKQSLLMFFYLFNIWINITGWICQTTSWSIKSIRVGIMTTWSWSAWVCSLRTAYCLFTALAVICRDTVLKPWRMSDANWWFALQTTEVRLKEATQLLCGFQIKRISWKHSKVCVCVCVVCSHIFNTSAYLILLSSHA